MHLLLAAATASLALLLGGGCVDAIAATSPFKCSSIAVGDAKYDLSALNKEWKVAGRIPLRFNPCGPIAYANEACPRGASSMCAMDPEAPTVGRANIGTITEVYQNPKKDLVMLYTRGSFDMNGFPFISLVRFECDKMATKDQGPLEAIQDGTKYFLIWKTPAACPIGKGPGAPAAGRGGLLGALATALLVGAAVYFVGGTVYNMLARKKTLKEAIPHFAFLANLFDFIRELFANILARLSSTPAGGYQQI